MSTGSDHQSLRLRAPSFSSGGGSGTLMSIIVLISVIFTILSATTTEVTIKGLGSLAFAILGLTLGVRTWERSHHSTEATPVFDRRTVLEQAISDRFWPQTSLRLVIGSVVAGAVVAIIAAALLSTLLGQVLDRLS